MKTATLILLAIAGTIVSAVAVWRSTRHGHQQPQPYESR